MATIKLSNNDVSNIGRAFLDGLQFDFDDEGKILIGEDENLVTDLQLTFSALREILISPTNTFKSTSIQFNFSQEDTNFQGTAIGKKSITFVTFVNCHFNKGGSQ